MEDEVDALRQKIEQLKLKVAKSSKNNQEDFIELDLNKNTEEVSTSLGLNSPTPMDFQSKQYFSLILNGTMQM